ncbi:MAG TPA: ABC transporter permease, partial [Candidatus Eremiobacteraeota bacterium]|nr:ABC transporter permease [Candidatus Eremiobacteraeota bacterium]
MKLVRLKAIARKEVIQIMRDPGSLAMAILMPVVMIVLYSYCLSLNVEHLSTVIWDQDRQELSREYLDCFKHTKYFDVKYYATDYKEIRCLMDSATCSVAIVIPPDFTRNLKSSGEGEIQVIIDGSDTNVANTARGYVSAITQIYNLQLAERAMALKGIRVNNVIDNRVRVLYNEELESRNFIIPGLIAVVIMVIAALLTALTIAKEWDRGNMEQLIATPVTAREIITGKLVPYIAIGFIDVMLAVATGTIIFKVPLRGSFLEIILFSFIFIIGVMSWGIMLSVIAKNQLLAFQMAILTTFLPSFWLSGFMFPIYCMPSTIQYITYMVPARYFITIMKGIFLKGVGIDILWFPGLLLLLYTI